MRAQRVCPGERVLIAGSGPLNLQLACELLAGGVKPLAVVEAAPRPGLAAWRDAWAMARAAPDLVREGFGMLVTLKRAGVPVLWSARVKRLDGDGRVQSAHVAGRAFDRSYEVDVVALNLGFQPETGLARALGATHRFVDVGLGHLATETDADGRTAVRGRVRRRRRCVAGRLARRDGARPAGRAGGGARSRPAGAGRTGHACGAGAGAGVPGCAVAAVPADPAAARLADRRNDRLPLRGGHGGAAARGNGRRPDLAGGTEEGDACRHGALSGPFLLGHHRAALCPDAPDDYAFAAPRAPLRPVPAAPLMFEAPEFEAPLLERRTRRRACIRCRDAAGRDAPADVLVIGGGLAGLCTAYFLARDGADVLLVERDEAGMAASTANAGSLHVQLLSYDFTDDTPADGGPGGAHAAAGAAQHRAVEADRRPRPARASASAPRAD